MRCTTELARGGTMPCGRRTCTSTGISRLRPLAGTGADFAPVPASRRLRAGFFPTSKELVPGGDTLGVVRRVSLRGSLSKVDTVPTEEQAEVATESGMATICDCGERLAAAAAK